MTEAQLLQRILDLAKLTGWRVHHCRPAQRANGKWATPVSGNTGFPDLVLARSGVVLFRELKSDKGAAFPEQLDWGHELRGCWGVWRPRDWPEIEATMTAKRPTLQIGSDA